MRHQPVEAVVDRAHETLRVIVADGDPLVRRVVRDALQDAGVVVIAESGSQREIVELALYYRPDVVLTELALSEGDGLEATRRISATDPDVKVVVLTATDDDDVALAALRAGACGFLIKSADLGALPRALHGAMAGEAVVSRRLTTRLVQSMRTAQPDGIGTRPVRSVLTPREWEVLDLLCLGESTYGIAETLVLSTDTVRSHIKNLRGKLGVSTRQAAVEEARRLRGELHSRDARLPLVAGS
jgi:two-component system, NarL family, response regulator LiaR